MIHINKTKLWLLSLLSVLFCSQSMYGQLNGTYTVYGTSPNYATLQAAASALSAGVSGPVTFKIRPGTWTDANTVIASLGAISGASATNTITFEAENGDPLTTILVNTNTSTTAGTNNIFYFNGAKYIRVRNLTLNKSNSSAGTVLRFNADAQYNTIENCVLTGASVTSSSTNTARIFGSSLTASHYNVIKNNTIVSGAYGVYWMGVSTSTMSNYNEFTGNKFNEQYSAGLYVYYTNYLKIQNNTITRTTNPTASYYAIQAYYPYSQPLIENNTISMTGGTTSNYGIYVAYISGSSSLRGSISSNTMSISGSSTQYGLRIEASSYYSANSNNITLTNSSTGTQYPLRNYNTSTAYGIETYVNSNTVNTTGNGTVEVWGHYYSTNGQFNNNVITMGSTTNSGSRSFYATYLTSSNTQNNNNQVYMNTTSGTVSMYTLYQSVSNSTFNGNTVVMGNPNSAGTRNIYFPYSSTSGCVVDGNTVTAYTNNSTASMYAYYSGNTNCTFTNNSFTRMTYTGTSTQYIYLGYSGNSNMLVKGNTFTLTGPASATRYNYIMYSGNTGSMEFSNNTMNVSVNGGTYYNYVDYSNTSSVTYHRLNGNNISMISSPNSATLYNYLGYSLYNQSQTNECMNNNITMNSTTSGSSYNYMCYNSDGCTMTGNNTNITGNLAYGIMTYGYSSGSKPWYIKNNTIKAFGNSSTVYGLYCYYVQNAEIMNNSIYAKSSSTCYGLIGGYNGNGGAKYYNNTIHTDGTSTTYTFYCYQSSGGQFASIRNNVISRAGGSGYLVYMYQPTSSYYDMDYNNLFNNGATMFYFAQNGATYANVTAVRAGLGWNKNSLSYNPGFMNTSIGDLRPDPANPNSWSVNGRGEQIANNDKDINGNARALTTIQGVPDLGAYEFTPTSTPPNCTLTPAAPVPSGTQYVTFGEDSVAVIRWGTTVPTGFNVKQYTGTNPPGITAINPTQMFYYADFLGSGTALDYSFDLYYKDPWLGSIASKTALRLAEKVGSNNWVGYSPTVSQSNIVRNYIRTSGVQNLQSLYTGIDVGNNAGADAIVEPAPPFCPGTYTVKVRIKNNGNNTINTVKIAYSIDGSTPTIINYTTPININGHPSGNSAIITLTNVTFGKAAVNVKVWTFEPNGVQDPITLDDTLNKDYFAALSGTYTVGGTTPHFPTPLAAVNALNAYGTCGDVIFDVRPGTYTAKLNIANPVPVPSTSGRVKFRSENGNASSVVINYASTVSGVDPTIALNDADRFTFEKLTVTASGSVGQAFGLFAAADNDSIVGCILNAPTSSNSYNSTIQAYTSYNSFTGSNLVVKNSKLNGGYYSFWLYPNTYKNGYVIDSNEITGFAYMGLYSYYSNGLRMRDNIVRGSGSSTYYGVYMYYAYQSPWIIGNKISNVYGYPLYMVYPTGNSTTDRAIVKNNSTITTNTTTTYYGLGLNYPTNMDMINNTFVNNGTSSSTYYGAYLYISSYSNNRFYNNVFANMSGGYALYGYIPSGYNNDLNYNNPYTTSTTQFYYDASSGSTAAKDFNLYRTTYGFDKDGISYNPAITSATNPAPDVTNPACWSLNGRALHITGNDKDIDGKPRFTLRASGVPDIGAYEIVPEVLPPLCTITPATADVGQTQVFSFGGNEVGQIKWGLRAPTAPIEVRQYSGEKGPNVAAAAAPAGSMFFHTDIKPVGNAVSFDYEVNVDYMDIWLGDILNENILKLAHQVPTYPWMVYGGSLSAVNATTNNLDAAELTRFGAFTGLEDGTVPSAFVRALGSPVICIGNSVQLVAQPQNGNNYKWFRNGVAIPGFNGPNAKTYTATTAGDYSVEITYSSKSVESVPLVVSTIAAPNALVNANKSLTYCPGNGLMLDAGTAQGVKYQWQLNGNNIPGATNSTFPVNQAGNYTVVVTNIGCSSTSTVTPVSAGPLSISLGDDTSYCEIKNVYATLDAKHPGARYKWNTGDTTQVIEVKQGGTYWVEVDGGPNCVANDTIEVTIDPLPKANGISFVQNGNTYQFYPSGPVGVVGFLWLFSDGSTSSQPSPVKTITGDLYVRLVMFNACGSDTVQLGWPLSVSSTVSEEQVSVYPNPAKDQVNISVNGAKLETVEILNSVGSVVYRAEAKGMSAQSINVSALANGHYMLRATTTSGTVNKQFDILR